MNSKKFFDWCRTAVSSIKHWPQRDAIHEELYAHLEDRYTGFREAGASAEEAENKALAGMGDAQEVADQLAKNFKPIWPKLLFATRIGIAVSLAFAIAVVLIFVKVDDIMPMTQIDMIYRNLTKFSLDTNVTQQVDGYTMTVKRVAFEPYMRDYSEWYTMGHLDDTLLVEVVVTHPQIWMNPPETIAFWARDNTGHGYEVGSSDYYFVNNKWRGSVPHTGLFEYTYQLKIFEIDAENLDWVELRTTYNGKKLVWRIDLPGGDAS